MSLVFDEGEVKNNGDDNARNFLVVDILIKLSVSFRDDICPTLKRYDFALDSSLGKILTTL